MHLANVYLSFLTDESVSAALLETSAFASHGHSWQQCCGQYGGHVWFSFVPECRWHICAPNPQSKSIYNRYGSLFIPVVKYVANYVLILSAFYMANFTTRTACVERQISEFSVDFIHNYKWLYEKYDSHHSSGNRTL